MKLKFIFSFLVLTFLVIFTNFIALDVYAAPPADPDAYEGVIKFLDEVKGGVSTKQPDFVNKQIGDYTGELTVRKIIIYVADRAISFFSIFALVLLVLSGISIIANSADEGTMKKQGMNIAAILGSIFFMHLGRTVVDIFFQERGVGEPTADIADTVEKAKQFLVEPFIDLGLSFLAIIAIAFVIYNALLSLVSSSDDGKSAEHQSNVLYGMAGILIVMLARPIVRVFYDFNFERDSLGKPMEPNFSLGIDIAYELVRYGLGILVFVAISLIIAAGYMMVVHFGNDNMVSQAKNIIKYVIVGFAIILSAYSLVAVLGVAPI